MEEKKVNKEELEKKDPDMKYCTSCGKAIKKASRFCYYCGQKQNDAAVEKITVGTQNASAAKTTNTAKAANFTQAASSLKSAISAKATSFTKSENAEAVSDPGPTNNDFYIVEFAKNIARKSNTSILIYLVLNVLIIAFIVGNLFSVGSMLSALVLGILLYAVSMAIALSFVGEAILRFQTGCHKIKRQDQLECIQPLFQEVYDKARALTPSIPDDVQIYINEDESPNAFATGRKTICVTKGLLERPTEEIKATLGHEFGHLAHHDTDLILVISIGNLVVTAILVLIKLAITLLSDFTGLLCRILGIFGGLYIMGLLADGMVRLCGFLANLLVSGGMWVWMKLGNALVLQSSRANEFEADEYSFQLGYGNALCQLFDNLDCGEESQGLFASLASSHPATSDRISHLQELGVEYRHVYGANNTMGE